MENKDNRMRELVKLFTQKDEIFSSKENVSESSDALKKEYSRLKDLASGDANADFKESYMAANTWGMGAQQGKTVNSIVDQMYDNPTVAYKPIRQPLMPDEAFALAIKRTLKSGAPVQDMGFYDEVNWHLQSLGFSAKNPLDIKNTLLKMIETD